MAVLLLAKELRPVCPIRPTAQTVRQLRTAVALLGAHPQLAPAERRSVGNNLELEVNTQEAVQAEPRVLEVGVLGVPNAGKSTLTNALVGDKVSAVSPKTNTTASARLGAFLEGATQVVLYDTPGVVGPQQYGSRQHRERVRSAWGTAAACELLLFIIDAHRQIVQPDPRVVRLVTELGSGRATGGLQGWACPPTLLVLNKVDLLSRSERPHLLRLTQSLQALHEFQDTFPASALTEFGLNELRHSLVKRAKPGRWKLDSSTDASEADRALEVVREKIFLRLHQELPYAIVPRHVSWQPFRNGSLRIEQVIEVPTQQVKRIVVGAQGAAIGKIGIEARRDLEEMFQCRVHLILNVKVRSS